MSVVPIQVHKRSSGLLIVGQSTKLPEGVQHHSESDQAKTPRTEHSPVPHPEVPRQPCLRQSIQQLSLVRIEDVRGTVQPGFDFADRLRGVHSHPVHSVIPPPVLRAVREDSPNRNFLLLESNVRRVRQGVRHADVAEFPLVLGERRPHLCDVPVVVHKVVELPLDERPQRHRDRVDERFLPLGCDLWSFRIGERFSGGLGLLDGDASEQLP